MKTFLRNLICALVMLAPLSAQIMFPPSGGGGGGVLYVNFHATVAQNTTTYIAPGYGTADTTAANRAIYASSAGTVAGLIVSIYQAPVGCSATVTVQKGGVDQALTVTIPDGTSSTTFSDTTHSFAVVAGDTIGIKVATGATCSTTLGLGPVTLGLMGPSGPAGPAGAAGPTGPAGSAGANGANGADGRTVLNGTGIPPAGTGADGDFFINKSTWDLYGPKTSGSWTDHVSLIGPVGPQGPQGATGPAGQNGTGTMNSLNGATGDVSMSIGGTGTAPNFSGVTLNLPNALNTGVTAGLVSNTDYVAWSAKIGGTLTTVGAVPRVTQDGTVGNSACTIGGTLFDTMTCGGGFVSTGPALFTGPSQTSLPDPATGQSYSAQSPRRARIRQRPTRA
jgi:hypothetical protein